jgi:hypothetical protein
MFFCGRVVCLPLSFAICAAARDFPLANRAALRYIIVSAIKKP